MTYNPYVGPADAPPPEGITLDEYAAAWIDMAPHTAQLTELATHAKTIVEFGVRGAVSTWALLDGLPPDGKLFGVDVTPDRDWCATHYGPDYHADYYLPLPPRVRQDPRFTLIVGDSVTVGGLPDHADLVMIDSSHEYLQTVMELERAARMTPQVIALHDYLYLETPDVRRAVDEFVADGPYRLEVLHPSKWGLAVLTPVL